MTGAAPFLVDANVLLRFLLNDHPEHSRAAKRVVARAQKREVSLEVPYIALIETVFTLGSFYKRKKSDIARDLITILTTPGINFGGPAWVLDALEEFGKRSISFGDCCLAMEARLTEIPVLSFDKDLDAFEGVVRVEPQ